MMKCPSGSNNGTNVWALGCDDINEAIFTLEFPVPKDVAQFLVWYRNIYVDGALGELSLLQVHIEEYARAELCPRTTCGFNALSTNTSAISNIYKHKKDNVLENREKLLLKSYDKNQ